MKRNIINNNKSKTHVDEKEELKSKINKLEDKNKILEQRIDDLKISNTN